MIRKSSRTLVRFVVLVGTALEYCARFGARRARRRLSPADRAQWLHESCLCGLHRLHIEVRTEGAFPARGLLISNHMSYLDILVYGSVAPCVFVSKKEVKSWPIFGQMARMAGTVFIDRSRAADTRRVNSEMQEALGAGAVVVLFPEGTSSDGTGLLPFRPALFDAPVRTGEGITPAHLSYKLSDGSPENDVAYWGPMSFFPHLLKLLSKTGIRATIRFSAASHKFGDRKVAAEETRGMVLELAQSSSRRQSEAVRAAS